MSNRQKIEAVIGPQNSWICTYCGKRYMAGKRFERHVLACKKKTPEIHVIDISSFKACRQRWDFTSNIRMNLEPRTPIENFAFGDAIHQALSVYYESGLTSDGVDTQKRSMNGGYKVFDQAIKDWYNQVAAVSTPTEEINEQFDEYLALGHSMLEQYARFAVVNDDFEVLWTERVFHIPMMVPTKTGRGKRRVVYSFRTDGLVRDFHNRLFVLEFKTSSQISDNTDYLVNDDQVGKYIWALNQLPEVRALGHIEGVIYRWLKKKVPSHMKPLATKPHLSLDKRVDTTYEIAIADIKQHHDGRVPAIYKEFLDHLRAKGNNFIREERVRRNDKEIAMIGSTFPIEIAEMVNDPAIYRTPNQFNCNGCAFFAPCSLVWEQRDASDVLATEYKQRENRYAVTDN